MVTILPGPLLSCLYNEDSGLPWGDPVLWSLGRGTGQSAAGLRRHGQAATWEVHL